MRTGVRSAPYRLIMYIYAARYLRASGILGIGKKGAVNAGVEFFGLFDGRNVDLLSILFGCGYDIRFAYHVAYKFKGFCLDVVLVRVGIPLGQCLYSDRLRNRSPDIGMYR